MLRVTFEAIAHICGPNAYRRQTVRATATVTIKLEQEVIPKLSNGATFGDLE